MEIKLFKSLSLSLFEQRHFITSVPSIGKKPVSTERLARNVNVSAIVNLNAFISRHGISSGLADQLFFCLFLPELQPPQKLHGPPRLSRLFGPFPLLLNADI